MRMCCDPSFMISKYHSGPFIGFLILKAVKNLKMRKSSLIAVVFAISLLNVAKPISCDNSIEQELPVSLPQVSGALDESLLMANTKRVGDFSVIESLGNVELESIPSANKDQQLTTDYHPAACQLVQIVHLLQHPGCQPKAVASFACSGSCTSYVKTSTSSFWQHVRSCSCCQQTGSREATFALDCPSLDPPYRKVKTYAPTDCLCRSCTDLSREDLRPQELVEALAGELINRS